MKLAMVRTSAVVAGSLLCLATGVPTLGSGILPAPAGASTVPSCLGNSFLGGWVGKNGATGTSIFQVAFVNDGHTTCRLAGYPTIQGYRDGREYQLRAGHLKGQAFDLAPTVVKPRMSAEMLITTSALCNALNSGGQAAIKRVIARTTYTVSVKFPHSNFPVDVLGLNVNVACGLNITALGWR